MFISKDSIVINGISMGKYLTEVNYQYPKLWGDDTGRVLSGEFSGTLLGTFPKFTLHFRKLSKSELELLAPIFDSAEQTFTYYDPVKKANITVYTYTGDWSVSNRSIIGDERNNESFEISFISKRKRD